MRVSHITCVVKYQQDSFFFDSNINKIVVSMLTRFHLLFCISQNSKMMLIKLLD
jgi:hypothetical protein